MESIDDFRGEFSNASAVIGIHLHLIKRYLARDQLNTQQMNEKLEALLGDVDRIESALHFSQVKEYWSIQQARAVFIEHLKIETHHLLNPSPQIVEGIYAISNYVDALQSHYDLFMLDVQGIKKVHLDAMLTRRFYEIDYELEPFLKEFRPLSLEDLKNETFLFDGVLPEGNRGIEIEPIHETLSKIEEESKHAILGTSFYLLLSPFQELTYTSREHTEGCIQALDHYKQYLERMGEHWIFNEISQTYLPKMRDSLHSIGNPTEPEDDVHIALSRLREYVNIIGAITSVYVAKEKGMTPGILEKWSSR